MFRWMPPHAILAEEVLAGTVRPARAGMKAVMEQWILRVNWLHDWMPVPGIPAVGDGRPKVPHRTGEFATARRVLQGYQGQAG